MYSDKTNVNILTALLRQAGICRAVVCPGSRNAAIVHNLCQAGIDCLSVADERSAAFYALGLIDTTGRPVVLCVTSGTAVADTLPAVAEAHYRHLPLIVVSADRPAAWIGQLDGQTIPQPGILRPFTAVSVQLPEPADATARWHCNRLINEALLEAFAPEPGPVQINVPITEPLFSFTEEALPRERLVRRIDSADEAREYIGGIMAAGRTLVVVGQTPDNARLRQALAPYAEAGMLASEPLSAMGMNIPVPHEKPEYVVYIGGTIVSKATKAFLRDPAIKTIRIGQRLEDTFMNTVALITSPVLASLPSAPSTPSSLSSPAQRPISPVSPSIPYSSALAVSLLERTLDEADYDFRACYANSLAVRLGCLLATHYTYVHRGANGIEGSLSSAAGMSLATGDMVFCVVGDLSFFYDSNALHNPRLGGNLRILLLNNGGGAIFRTIAGLDKSPALDEYVAAAHTASARALCECFDIGYLAATDQASLEAAMERLTQSAATRPLLLEAFTDKQADAQAFRDLARQMGQ